MNEDLIKIKNECTIDEKKSFETLRRGNKVKLIMELFTEFIFIKGVRERLIEFFFVEFVSFDEKTFDFVIIVLFPRFEFENSEYFNFSDSIKSINSKFAFVKNKFTWEVVDSVDRSEVLTGLLDPFLIEEIKTRIAMKLDVELISWCLVRLEKEWFVIFVYYQQVMQSIICHLCGHSVILHHFPYFILFWYFQKL